MATSKLWLKQIAVYGLSGLLITQPALAQIQEDQSAPDSQQPTVTTTEQGTPLVNIATPNANGLSHNQFETFSVDESHLILNNSDQSVNTVIGGQIDANPNLTNGTASIILNEVTGSQRTNLDGYTEIAGDQAELIIANPNGITCDGCGFINTPRAVLSTGTPQITNGQLMSLSVNQGDIRIEGDGLNAGNLEQVDLISREAQIHGQLMARDLNVITGRNQVDYQSLDITPNSGSAANQPALAIDSSELGGMYANTIHLIATEQGVGVNLAGDMATNTGGVTLSADGTISINSASTTEALTISSTRGDVTINSLAYGESVAINAQNNLNNQGTLAASGDIQLDATTISNTGSVVAGLNTDSSLQAGANIDLNATTLNNQGQVIGTNNIAITASEINNQQGLVEAAAGDLNLDQVSNLNNAEGTLRAANQLTLSIDQFTPVNDHGLDAGTKLIINTNNFNNEAEFEVSADLELNLQQDFTNSGELETGGDLTVNAQTFNNQSTGKITAEGEANITTPGDTENQGVLTAANGMAITAENITNRGALASGDTLTLNAQGTITNSNADENGLPISLQNLLDDDIDLSQSTSSANGTLLFSVGDMNLYSDNLTNRYADLYSFGNLTIAADESGSANSTVLNSSAYMEAAGNLTITTQSFENRRDLITPFDYSDLCTPDSTSYLCTHNIVGGDELGIPSDTPLSEAWLFDQAYELYTGTLSDDEKYIRSQEILKTLLIASREPSVFAGNNMTINAGSFANRGGLMSAANDFTVNANDYLNETVVAATLGIGIHPTEYYALGAFYGPYVLNNTHYYDSNGSLSEYQQSILDSDLPFFYGPPSGTTEDRIVINLHPIIRRFPLIIYKDGIISAYIDGDKQPLLIDENGELTIPTNRHIPITLEEFSSHLQQDGNGNYQLTLGNDTYPLTIQDDGRLQVQFDPANMPIEFTIQEALENYPTTAEDNITYTFETPYQAEEINTTFFPGKIRAGGTLTINATNTFSNGLAEEGVLSPSFPPSVTLPSTDISDNTGSDYTAPAPLTDNSSVFNALDNAIPPASDFEQVDVDTEIPDNGGLFTESDDDRFLVATNAAVSQFIGDYGSDYLLEQLNYQPEQDLKRLGDGFYESFLIRDAIMGQTGRRFLHSSLRNDRQQMRYLMDNAIAAQGAMDLTLGVRLTSDQVAALTHDMLWMEERTINGQRVLVPTLYLANVSASDLSPQGNILARGINLNVGQLNNRTSIVSDSFLNINASQDFFNQGRLQAAGDSTLSAGNDISLVNSPLFIGGNLALQAGNDLTIDNADVNADASIALQAGNDLTIDNADVNADASIVLQAGGNITVNNREQAANDSPSNPLDNARSTEANTNTTGLNAGNNLSVFADGDLAINHGPLSAREGSLTLVSGEAFYLGADQLNVGQDIALVSGQSINNQSDIDANGSLTIVTEEDFTNAGNSLSAEENLTISTGGDLILDATSETTSSASASRERDTRGLIKRKESSYQSSTEYTGSTVSAGGNVTLDAGNDLAIRSSTIDAEGDITLAADGDIEISAYQNEYYSFHKRTKNKDTGKEVKTTESLRTRNVASELNAGGNITINSQINDDGSIRTGNDSGTVNISSSTINAGEQVVVYGGEVNVTSQKELDYYKRRKQQQATFGFMGGTDKGSVRRNEILANSDLTAAEDLSLLSANDVKIFGSELMAGGDLNLSAVGDILVSADLVLSQTKEWSRSSSLFSSLDTIYEEQEKVSGQTSATAVGSQLNAQGNINLDASRVTIAGSDLNAGNNIRATTDVGDINIIGTAQTTSTFEQERTVSVTMGDVANQLMDVEGQFNELTDTEETQASLTLAEAQYHSADTQNQITDERASQLVAGGNIELDAAGDIAIRGADVVADSNLDQQGDLNLRAGGDVIIAESQQTQNSQSETLDGTAEISLVGQHQAVEVVKAAEDLGTAKEQLKQAEEDYRQYEKDLDRLADRRDQLQADYQEGVPGVRFEDIVELDQLIDDLESDEDWYRTGVVLAAANVASKTTLLIQQTAAAASSVSTYGFNAGIQLDISATANQSEQSNINSRGSFISAENINIQTGTQGDLANSATTVRGSNLMANSAININTGDLSIEASRNTSRNLSETQHVDLRQSQMVHGGSSTDINISRDRAKDGDRTVTNSTLSADTINLTTEGDATLKGTNVHANDSLTLNIGDDLTVQSLQNTYSANNQSAGISAGLSDGSVSGGLNAGSGRTRTKETELTTLTGGTVNINVEDNTRIIGATIAATDEEGKDNGQLTLNTDTLEVGHLNNSTYNNQRSQSLNSGATRQGDVTTTNITYSNTTNISETRTLATVGQGEINVRDDEASEDATADLNRDIDNNTLDLYEVDRQQGNIDLTVDTRLLTEDGRQEILDDIRTIGEAGDRLINEIQALTTNLPEEQAGDAAPLMEAHLNELIRQGGDPQEMLELMSQPEYQAFAESLLYIRDKVNQEGVSAFLVDNNGDQFIPDLSGDYIQLNVVEEALGIQLLQEIGAVANYISTLPVEQAEAALFSIEMLAGGPVKTLLQTGASIVVDTMSQDIQESIRNGVTNALGNAAHGGGIDYSWITNEEQLEEAYTIYQNGQKYYGQLNPEEQSYIDYLGEFFTNQDNLDILTEMQSTQQGAEFASTVFLGSIVAAGTVVVGSTRGGGQDNNLNTDTTSNNGSVDGSNTPDTQVPEGYTPLQGLSSNVNNSDLPDGFVRVADSNGETRIASPDGTIYDSVDDIPAGSWGSGRNGPENSSDNSHNLSGSGPRDGLIEVSSNYSSSALVQNFRSTRPTDFVYDSKTDRFVIGTNKVSQRDKTVRQAGHPETAAQAGMTIDDKVVGGTIRYEDGKLVTNEHSGRLGQNWTPEIRQRFEQFMKDNNIDISHSSTWD